MFSVFKNVTIILMALLESHLYGKPIRALKWTAFGLIVASSVVGGFHDLSFSALGYVWMALNCLSSAAYGLGMQAVIKQVAFENGDTMFFNNLLASPVILVLSVLTEHPFAPDSRYHIPSPLHSSMSSHVG
jgi:GDP-mannose transporter